MSNRANLIGSKLIYEAPTETLLTNTQVDLIATPITSTDIYPHAYTATLATRSDLHNWRTVATDVDITAFARIAFGLFLSSEGGDKGSMLYHCKGAMNFHAEAGSLFKVYPIFGRLNSSAPVSTLAGTANQLVSYIVLPAKHHPAAAENSGSTACITCSVDEEVILVSQTNGNPLFFGFVIENISGGTPYNIDQLNAAVCFQKFNSEQQCYDPRRG